NISQMRLLLLLTLLFSVMGTSHQADKMALRFGTIRVTPFVSHKRRCLREELTDDCKGNDAFEGYMVDFMALLARELNSNYTFEIGNSYGRSQKNGTWDGLIGSLVASEIDVIAAPMLITPERSPVIDFSPFFSTGISAMILKPGRFDLPTTLNPYSSTTWVSIVALEILTIATVVGLWMWMKRGGKMDRNQPRFVIWLCCFFAWLVVSLFFIISLSLHVYLCNSWSSRTDNVCGVVTLTEEEHEKIRQVQSIEEILEKEGRIKFGVFNGGWIHNFLKNSNNTLHRRIYETMENNNESFVSSYPHGIEKVRMSEGSFVFIVEDVVNEWENGRLPCDTRKVGENLHTIQYGVATTKDSKLTEPIRTAIESLKITGELEKLHHKWFVERSRCHIDTGIEDMEMEERSRAERTASWALCGLAVGVTVSVILSVIAANFEKRRGKDTVKLTDELTPMAD
ncbi:hypothetical protein PFISCL1PPCAC_13595, partial [Pristionchus fissidentatus]